MRVYIGSGVIDLNLYRIRSNPPKGGDESQLWYDERGHFRAQVRAMREVILLVVKHISNIELAQHKDDETFLEFTNLIWSSSSSLPCGSGVL